MSFNTGLKADFDNFVTAHGTQVSFKYFTEEFDEGSYDDDMHLISSGNSVWCSGIILPMQSNHSPQEAEMLKQGDILQGDRILYVPGSISTSGTFRVGIGSPNTEQVFLTSGGVKSWGPDTTIIYKKLYVRHLQTGSLDGEY